MDALSAFLFGMAGALAPEVVRLYNIRQSAVGRVPSFYFIISAVFAALGGLVAVILPATTPWAAFYAGISMPVLVNTALRQATNGKHGVLRDGLPRARPPGNATAPSLRHFVRAL